MQLHLSTLFSYVDMQYSKNIFDIIYVICIRHNYNQYLLWPERQSDRLRLYNLASVGEERQWLRDVLLSSETESSSEDDTPAAKDQRIKRLLRERHFHNKYVKEYYKDPGVRLFSTFFFIFLHIFCILYNYDSLLYHA